jgi:hypothetical protein
MGSRGVNHIAKLFAGDIRLQSKNFLFKQQGSVGRELFFPYPVLSSSLKCDARNALAAVSTKPHVSSSAFP